MSRAASVFLGAMVAAVLVAGPMAYVAYQHRHLRHFREVREGVLYRSGQMSVDGLKQVVRDFGIRTVVTLRDADSTHVLPPDHAEEAFCRERGINHVRITPRVWAHTDGAIPAEQGVHQLLQVMDDARHFPVLIHCFAGVHRTGALCAIYRMEYENWTNADAIAEMKHCGYDNLDDEHDVLGYIRNYKPRQRDRSASVILPRTR